MPDSEIKVRSAVPGDFDNIIRQYGTNGNTPWSPFGSIEKLSNIPLKGLLVAEVNGEYAGFLYWFEGSFPKNDYDVEKYAYIIEVNPLPKFSNKQVGLYLHAEALKQAEAMGLYTSYILANERNSALCKHYEKIGYTVMDRTLQYRLTNPKTKEQKKMTRDKAREIAVHAVEVSEQCRTILVTYKELRELIEIEALEKKYDTRVLSSKVWTKLQSIMSSVAIISKLLWPNPMPKKNGTDKTAILRARVLRKFLNIEEMNSVLPRNVRNAFEHIDVKLIEWLPNQSRDVPWGWSISPFDKDEEPGDSKEAFRYYNIWTEELRVGNANCDLGKIIKDIKQIKSKMPSNVEVNFGDPEKFVLEDPKKEDLPDYNDEEN